MASAPNSFFFFQLSTLNFQLPESHLSDLVMKANKPSAELVCKQFEDALAPRLRLSTTDRAVYYHLLRHSRFEGKSRLHFSIIWLARNLGLTEGTVRSALRRLVQHRALRLVQRSKAGHVMDVRLPEEVPGARRSTAQTRASVPSPDCGNLEEIDFMRTPELRQAIHAREGGVCFYCLRRIGPQMQCPWSLAASNATPAKASAPPPIFCALSIVRAV